MRSNILRAKIVEAGYNQKTFAQKINMSANTLSSKLNGRTPFDLDEVIEVCNVLKISDDQEKAYIFLS